MWKRVYELFVTFATLAQKAAKQEQKIQRQQDEIRLLTAYVQQLAHELQRVKDEQRHGAERETDARKLLELRIENKLLKAGRRLPPSTDDGEDED